MSIWKKQSLKEVSEHVLSTQDSWFNYLSFLQPVFDLPHISNFNAVPVVSHVPHTSTFFSSCWHNWVGVSFHLSCQSVRMSVSPVAFDGRWSSELFWCWLAFGGVTFISSLCELVFMVECCEHMETSPETRRCHFMACDSLHVTLLLCLCLQDWRILASLVKETVFFIFSTNKDPKVSFHNLFLRLQDLRWDRKEQTQGSLFHSLLDGRHFETESNVL